MHPILFLWICVWSLPKTIHLVNLHWFRLRRSNQSSPWWFYLHVYILKTPSHKQQACIQLPTSAVNVALPTFAAAQNAVAPCCCSAGCAANKQHLLPVGSTVTNLPQCCCSRQMGQTDRQTDKQTPYRYIDPALHTMRAMPITEEIISANH